MALLCPYCDKTFKTEAGLNWHLEHIHNQRGIGSPAVVQDIENRYYELNQTERPSSTFFDKVVRRWQADPVGFIRDILGVELWSKQRQIAESVRDNERTAVRSCSAGGKTAVAACIVLWFLCAFRPCTVLTTAKSHRQVKEQLWREIRTRHAKANPPIGGDVTQLDINLDNNWFAKGFSTDEPERITGFHNENVLVVIDEASGIEDAVYGAIDNPLAAGFTRLLLLGNPTQTIGKFYDAFSSEAYKSFHISAFDTPGYTGEGAFPFLISKKYVNGKIKEWGEDSPLYEVYILGNFPSGEGDRLIPFGLAEQATRKVIKPEKDEVIAIGCDLARLGEDESVLYIRQGGKIIQWKTWRKAKTEACIGQIAHEINWVKDKFDRLPIVNVDEGYNPGVVDGLSEQGFEVNGIAFGSKAHNDKWYANKRAEMFFELADRFKTEDISIPDDKVLLKQITDIKPKGLNRQDQRILESKEEMKHRGVKSPDRADALALCFYETAPNYADIRWL